MPQKGLKERGNSKLAKKFIEYVYLTCVLGIPNDIRQNSVTVVKKLRENKKSHRKCVSIEHLNINSIRNKSSDVTYLIDNNLNVFIITKTKLDSSFPESQFLLEGMRKTYRLNVFTKKDGLKEDIPSKCLKIFNHPENIQAISFEISLKQRKLFAVTIYRPPDQNLNYFLPSIKVVLDHYLKFTKILSY